jgi:hypothetical protein
VDLSSRHSKYYEDEFDTSDEHSGEYIKLLRVMSLDSRNGDISLPPSNIKLHANSSNGSSQTAALYTSYGCNLSRISQLMCTAQRPVSLHPHRRRFDTPFVSVVRPLNCTHYVTSICYVDSDHVNMPSRLLDIRMAETDILQMTIQYDSCACILDN